jgi:predicted dehydrogenase
MNTKTQSVSDDTKPVRIGIVGATPQRGWAGMAHVPAIRAIPALTLQAVATRNETSARAAADAFGVPLWFDRASAMIEHEDVDAVVIAVRAPDHFELAKQALMLGKPVYCEWPFTQNIEQARELADLAATRNVVTAVGLQGQFSPWLRQVRDIVSDGRLGRILSTSMIAYDELSLGTVDQGNAYLLDVANGANPLTIHSGHYIDALCFALGELTTVSAMTSISRPQVVVRQTGETLIPTSPDQIVVSGHLRDGAIASFHMRAGSGDPSFLWEIQGDDGVLRVTSTGYLMWRPLKLELWDAKAKCWEPLPPPRPVQSPAGVDGLDGPAKHVGHVYAAFAQDILTGAGHSVSFSQALARRETMEAIRTSAIEGVAKSISDTQPRRS